MIYEDLVPINMVEHNGFKKLINVLEPNYVIPDAKTITTRIQGQYAEKIDYIKTKLTNVKSVALSTDCWMIRNTNAYVTVMGHFINDNWELNSFHICTQQISYNHSSENLSAAIQNVLCDWKLDNKVSGISLDIAANVTLTAQTLFLSDVKSNPCAAYMIQLAIKKSLDLHVCYSLIKKASGVIKAFNQSSEITRALETASEQLGKPKLNLLQNCPTRWVSTMCMLKRLLELRQEIEIIMTDRTYFTRQQAKKLAFTEEDWDNFNILYNLLKPLYSATTILCADQKVTISLIRPIIYGLIFNHLNINKNDVKLATCFKNIVSRDLSNRFSIGENSVEHINLAQIACLLDPRYKNLGFEYSDNVQTKIKEHLRSLMQNISQQTDDQNNKPMSIRPTAIDILLGIHSAEGEQTDELTNYLSEPQINHNLEPCNWWREHENNYPTIAMLAKQILQIPASSASSKRIFSTDSNIITSKRSRLDPPDVSALIFLHHNGNITLK